VDHAHVASTGNGPGTVTFTVAPNPRRLRPYWTMTVAGQTFTVNQAGVPCIFSINPTTASVSSGGTGGSLSSHAGWVYLDRGQQRDVDHAQSAGTGTPWHGDVHRRAEPEHLPRTGTMTVAGQTFTVIRRVCRASSPSIDDGECLERGHRRESQRHNAGWCTGRQSATSRGSRHVSGHGERPRHVTFTVAPNPSISPVLGP